MSEPSATTTTTPAAAGGGGGAGGASAATPPSKRVLERPIDPNRTFTKQQLRKYDGGYTTLAGRDSSRVLAKMDFSQIDVEGWDDFDETENETLSDWITKFDLKYPIVGRYLRDNATATAAPSATATGAAAAAAANPSNAANVTTNSTAGTPSAAAAAAGAAPAAAAAAGSGTVSTNATAASGTPLPSAPLKTNL